MCKICNDFVNCTFYFCLVAKLTISCLRGSYLQACCNWEVLPFPETGIDERANQDVRDSMIAWMADITCSSASGIGFANIPKTAIPTQGSKGHLNAGAMPKNRLFASALPQNIARHTFGEEKLEHLSFLKQNLVEQGTKGTNIEKAQPEHDIVIEISEASQRSQHV